MNKNIYIVALLGSALLVQSCTSTERFNVTASPNQKLYLPSNLAAAVDAPYENGEYQMDVPSAYYLGYMTARDPETGLAVPFGLDVHKKSRASTKTSAGTGITVGSIGLVGMLTGLMVEAIGSSESVDDPDLVTSGLVVALSSMAVCGAGYGWGLPANQKLKQLAYQYQFTYDKNQSPYSGKLSKTLLNPNPQKQAEPAARKRAVSGDMAQSVAPSATTPAGTTVAKKSRKHANAITAGTYAAEGKLFKGNAVDEAYPDMQLVIDQAENGTYNVNVLESGEDFFGAPLVFEFSGKNENGDTILTLKGLPEATLTVTADGRLLFRHPAVLIDNEVYTLSVNGKK